MSGLSWVARHQVFAAVEPAEKGALALQFDPVGEIADQPDVVVLSHDRVPVRDHRLVHFLDGRERALAHLDDGLVPKMLVGGEVVLHRDLMKGRPASRKRLH